MKIEIPYDAIQHLNSRAAEFLLKLRPFQGREERKREETSFSHVVSRKIPGDAKVNTRSIWEYDTVGIATARYFENDTCAAGLTDDDYADCERFIDKIACRKEMRELVSKKCIQDITYEWFEKMYIGSLRDKRYADYLLERIEELVQKRTISIPISFMIIQSPFKIGIVDFNYFRPDLFDRIENHLRRMRANLDENADDVDSSIRNKYQGSVYASIAVEAESEKAMEIAKSEIDKALMVLRFFSPSSIIPAVPSYFSRKGQMYVPKSEIFHFQGDGLPHIINRVEEKAQFDWTIKDNDIAMMQKVGMPYAERLFWKSGRTDFEDRLMNAIALFCRAVVAKECHDKMVFVIVSLETLLLRDTSEPIQSTLGLRLAFILGRNYEQRATIIDTIKKAYKNRSSYVHHGIIHDEYQLLSEIHRYAWDALRLGIVDSEKYRSYKAYIDSIEKRILS